MSDTAVEVKETVATPEKEVPEKKVEEEKETNGDAKEKKETNGDAKKNGVEEEEEAEDDSTENGDDKDVPVAPKRKSDVSGDAADSAAAVAEGISPEKKAKLDEKVENGEAEATA